MSVTCKVDENSPFYYDVPTTDIRLYFSSMFNKRRYASRFANELKEINYRLEIRYKYPVDATELLAFYLYQQIEKRGFCYSYCNVKMRKLPVFEVKLNGDKMAEKG